MQSSPSKMSQGTLHTLCRGCYEMKQWRNHIYHFHSNSQLYVKTVPIRSFSGPDFLSFGLNTDIYGVNLHTQSEFLKKRTRKTPNTDNFPLVQVHVWFLKMDVFIAHKTTAGDEDEFVKLIARYMSLAR